MYVTFMLCRRFFSKRLEKTNTIEVITNRVYIVSWFKENS